MTYFEPTEMFGHFRREAMRGTFYVYVLRRPDGRPFYVGKGCGSRLSDHEGEARRGHNCHKCNVIRKIWREGGDVLRDIVFGANDEKTAYWFEGLLIRQWRNQLTNIVDFDDSVRKSLRVPKRKPLTKEQEHERRVNRALTMIELLDRRLTQALRRNREKEIERLETLIEAYELWLSPPIQLSLFD